MNRLTATGAALAAAVIAAAPLTARQDVALKDLMPKGMAIGVAINQRQSDGIDTAAVDIITKHAGLNSGSWNADQLVAQRRSASKRRLVRV